MRTAALRIGTRGSALALAQTRMVAALLSAGGEVGAPRETAGGEQAHATPEGPGELDADIEIVTVTTSGDRDAHAGDKSRWVDTIEDALLAGEIDLAVHSAKDVPGELADGLTLLGAPPGAPAEDVLCVASAPAAGASADGDAGGSTDLPGLAEGARVGTSSLRRVAQLRAVRADLDLVTMTGNVDTRLRRLAEDDDLDAIVLARAGLVRLGREDSVGAAGAVLDPARFVPAPGQGALALEGRAEDARVREAVAAIADADAFACLRAERALAQALDATCRTPLGAHAAPAGCGCLLLRAWVGLPDGSAWIADELPGGFYDPDELGRRVAERMIAAGAADLLRRSEEMATPAYRYHEGEHDPAGWVREQRRSDPRRVG